MKEKAILFLVSIALLAGVLYFSDVNKIAEILSKANLQFIFLGFSLWLLSCLVRSVRWQYLLKRIGINSPFSITARVYLAGMAISNLTPGKTGDPIRSVFLKKALNEPVGKSLSSLFIERMVEIIVMVSISLIGFIFLMSSIPSMSIWFILAASIFLGLSALGVFVFSSEKRAHSFVSKFCTVFCFIPAVKSLGSRAESFSREIHKSFLQYKDPKTLFVTVLLTSTIWLLEGAILYLSFASLGLAVTPFSAIVILPLATLIGVISFLPGSLGSLELIYIMFFTSLFPLTLPEITATILLNRLLSFWSYVVTGAVLMSTLKYKYKL